MSFLQKYVDVKTEKRSMLCIGLDPASPFFRQEANTIPSQYFEKASELEGMMDFCLDIIEKTKGSAAAYKLNAQYALPFSLADYRRITASIKKARALSILDIKLGDIGASNDACFYWAAQAGFDAITFSPFAGNIAEAAKASKVRNVALFVLTLMSNPEAGTFMRANVNAGSGSKLAANPTNIAALAGPNAGGTPAYLWIAQELAQNAVEGAVVGATNTTALELKQIRELAGRGVVFLAPGVGAQGGDAERIILHSGENLLINVGRDIIYSKNPGKSAEEYVRKFNDIAKRRQ